MNNINPIMINKYSWLNKSETQYGVFEKFYTYYVVDYAFCETTRRTTLQIFSIKTQLKTDINEKHNNYIEI